MQPGGKGDLTEKMMQMRQKENHYPCVRGNSAGSDAVIFHVFMLIFDFQT